MNEGPPALSRWQLFTELGDFARAAEAFLYRFEAENSLLTGLVESGLHAPTERRLWMGLLQTTAEIEGAFFSNGRNLILSRLEAPEDPRWERHLENAALLLHAQGASLPGVVGPPGPVRRFAQSWTRLQSGLRAYDSMHQKIHRLERVVDPPAIPGACEAASRADLDLLAEWVRAFSLEAVPDEALDETTARRAAQTFIDQKQLFVWRHSDGRPQGIASLSRPTRNGINVSLVYTPPAERRRGVAASLVAAVSRIGLEERGKRYCTLYTDVSNPTSNALYRRIGYESLADSLAIRFAR